MSKYNQRIILNFMCFLIFRKIAEAPKKISDVASEKTVGKKERKDATLKKFIKGAARSKMKKRTQKVAKKD